MRKASALLFLALACGPKPEEAPAEAAKTTTDETSVTMPAETAKENGIAVIALQPAVQQSAILIGNATVVDVTDLVNIASQYAAARAQRDQAAAHLQASRATFERLRALNADNHNVSDRAVQEAAAAAASDAASVRSADVNALATDATARQRWGAVLTRGIIGGASWARQLASREAVLVEAAFTNEAVAPQQIQITGAMGRPVTARHVAVSPRVDARLQKPVHDYLAPSAELPVGLITNIYAPVPSRGGVLVPKDAVVWNGSQALVFVEDRPGHYQQQAISAQTAVDNGFLETSLQPGTRVVVSGAQQLLSEQNKPEAD